MAFLKELVVVQTNTPTNPKPGQIFFDDSGNIKLSVDGESIKGVTTSDVNESGTITSSSSGDSTGKSIAMSIVFGGQMTAPNIVEVTTINGKTAVQSIGTSASAIVTNSDASGKVLKVNALYISNVDGTNNGSITVDLYRSSTAYHLAKEIVVPAKSTIDVLTKSVYLEEGDSLRLTAVNANYMQAICSYEEIS